MSEVQSQIDQMIRFIRQEAEEKAREVRLQTEEEFNILKQEEVEAERKRLREEFERREKQVEVERKIAHSNAINQNRLKVLKARDDAVQQILEQAREKIADHSKGAQYGELLTKLIVQGAVTLKEPNVTVLCREEDKGAVERVLSAAAAQIKEKTGTEVSLKIGETFLAPGGKGPGSCSGGVVLSARGGSIRCDNTLDTRLMLAYEGMLPQIRISLFGRSESRKHLN